MQHPRPLFVSFFITGTDAVSYGSTIIQMLREPANEDDLSMLRDSIAAEVGNEKVELLVWRMLPDKETHPGKVVPYRYSVTYAFYEVGKHGGMKRKVVSLDEPVARLTHLRSVEQALASTLDYDNACIVNIVPLANI